MARAMLPAIVIAIAVSGCRPSPAPAVSNTAPSNAPSGPWLVTAGELVDVIEDRVIAWDRTWDAGHGGLAESSALDGTHLRTRTIAGLAINGGLRMWQPVPGGYLAFWDGPAFVAERGDALVLGWRAPGDDWFESHVIVEGGVIVAGARAGAGIVRLALGDGHEAWRAALALGSQDVALHGDGVAVYAAWRDPDPAGARHVRALDPATGRTSWTYDLTGDPGALAVAQGTIVAALGGELHVIERATGRVRARVTLGPGSVYPALQIDRDRVFVALGDHVTALALATGATLWRAAVTLDAGPRLTLVGDAVVVSTASATVLALARDSGERRWEIGIGLAPAALVATSAALVARGSGRAVGFKLPPAIPSEAARLHGRVIGNACGPSDGAIVLVGGTRVALDATGHYHAELVARGIVTLSVTAAQLSSSSGAPSVAAIRLDGRGSYEVPDLAPSQCDASG